MLRTTAIILVMLAALPFLVLAALAGLGVALFVIGVDMLENPSWSKRVPGQSTGAEEEV